MLGVLDRALAYVNRLVLLRHINFLVATHPVAHLRVAHHEVARLNSTSLYISAGASACQRICIGVVVRTRVVGGAFSQALV